MINILVCDDDKEIVDAIEIYLNNDGYQIFKAYDGEQALSIIKKEEIHLVLMDIMMPRMNGLEATRLIRCSPDRPDLNDAAVLAFEERIEETEKYT